MIKPIQFLPILFQFAFISLNGSAESKWIPLNLSNEDGLSNSAITCIFQDTEGIMWFGTDGNGVYRYISKGKPLFSIKKGDSETGSLSHNIVRSVFKDQEGSLWCSAWRLYE